jgi:hypothetical protein
MQDEVVPFNDDLERRVKAEFRDEANPEFINLIRIGKAAYEHGYNNFISKEKFLEWVSKMYEGGKKQREIQDGKIEGMILINSSEIINAGSYLSLFGKKEGYLSN